MNIFNRKYTCKRCGKQVDRLYNGGALYTIGGCYCERCAEYQDKIDLELLEKIIKGQNFKSKTLGECHIGYDTQQSKGCDYFRPECKCGYEGEYLYDDTCYCKECLLKEFGVETYTVEHYMLDGEYLGDEDDLDEVIENLSEKIIRVDN